MAVDAASDSEVSCVMCVALLVGVHVIKLTMYFVRTSKVIHTHSAASWFTIIL